MYDQVMFNVHISIGILIAFYMFFIHALCSTCLVLNEVYLLCASVLGVQVYMVQVLHGF